MSHHDESSPDDAAKLVEVWRGPIVESIHRGHVAAVDGKGASVCELGRTAAVTYFRSSSKAFQALPVITSGAADRFGLTEKEIAIACGSHSGESIHVETVKGMLEKIGLDETALKCGTHEPFSVEAARELVRRGQRPSVLQNNCSGKHAAMLAFARHIGAPTDTYNELSNPVQQAIAQVISEFSDVVVDDLKVGVDGCGVPVFGLPVRAMALAYARLVWPESLKTETRSACRRLLDAMLKFPEMVGGSRDRLDTELIKLSKGRLISKIGAEGVYAVGVLPCERWPNGLGLALKVEDGDDRRARPPAVIEALRQLDVLHDEELTALSDYALIAITNRRGEPVGQARAAFSLNSRAK